MKLACPKCRTEIPLEDVNVSTDIALCRGCKQTYSFAELTQNETVATIDESHPPKGAWYHSQGSEFEVGATTRSWGALFLVPFTLVWSGGSLGGIYGSQIYQGSFNLMMSLFGIPFFLGSCVLIPLALMMVFGKVVVKSSADEGILFIGIGGLGRRWRFRWSEIKTVRQTLSKWTTNGQQQRLIELDGPKPIRFGSGLSEPRLNFMLAILRRRL